MARRSLSGLWYALYRNGQGVLTTATDALGYPIECDTARLAKSVARYRSRRTKRWR